MPLLSPRTIDIGSLSELASEVEGELIKSERSPALDEFKSALDSNKAGLEEVAAHLGQQLNTPFEEHTRTKAINTILQIHGFIGQRRDKNSGGDINIVVHTNEANLQSNMFSPQRSD